MRHPNGGGEVAGEAEANSRAYVDANSRVLDRARVHSGRIIASTIGLECRVSDGSVIAHSVCTCDEVVGATVISSGLFDQACVWPTALVRKVHMSGGARVYGDARVIGNGDLVHLTGDMRICYGTFHRAPRYVHLGYCFLTESAPGWAGVDCKFASYERWFRIGERYAHREYGWDSYQLNAVREVFTRWQAEEDMRGKHWGACVPGCGSDAYASQISQNSESFQRP